MTAGECGAGILLVDNAAISGAIKDVFNHCRTVLEPAGAVAVAGAKAYLKARPHLQVTSELPWPHHRATLPPRCTVANPSACEQPY